MDAVEKISAVGAVSGREGFEGEDFLPVIGDCRGGVLWVADKVAVESDAAERRVGVAQ